jgi:RsiW-degrading membrane proteinase PrsW (M82 family)
MDIDSTQFLYGVLSGMLPPLLWLWFWLKENHLHPEPRGRIAACFFFGMVAVLIAIPLQFGVSQIFFDNTHRYILWAFIEEILKFSAVYVVVFNGRKMDEPIDAVIYMITAALGFAALENTFFMLGAIKNSDLVSTIITGNFRFMGAILLHVVCSATVGFMLAVTFYHSRLWKIAAGIIALLIAGSLHAAFNLAIINSDSFNTLKAFGWVWGGVVLLVILFEEVKAVKPPALKTSAK